MNSTPTLMSSMRVRLTFWYTAVLAVVLLIFAVSTYSYLARAARQRTDESLSDTASAFISNLNSEVGDEHQLVDEAVKEATRGFYFRDRQVLVLDFRDNLIAASETGGKLPPETNWISLPAFQPQLRSLLHSAQRSGRAYATLYDSKKAIRVLAVAVPSPQSGYLVVVASPLLEQENTLSQARSAFYLAIPLALLLAGLGGYFLARKSLAPVVTMGDQAARIGASNLNERLPVPANNAELGRLARTFNELLSRLDESFAQQKRFMADASHELRTPVAVVCGESEVALSRPARNEAEYRESLAIVNDEGQRLTRLVEDLFTLARADAGEYPLVVAEFYLDESVYECIRSVRSLAAQKDLEIFYEAPVQEMPFRGDDPLIRRMVLNLLHNAIKYTPAGGEVRVRVGENQGQREIVISDTGPGIAAAARDQVFDRFFRVDKARSRDESTNGSGAGLGLAIAKWVAELHGGSIGLDRSDHGGATFVISLPNSIVS